MKKIPAQNIGEAVFDVLYLLFAFIAGILIIAKSGGSAGIALFGAAAVVLGAGDSFHLVPRVAGGLSGHPNEKALGKGKLVTSVTMTLFYVLLYYAGALLFKWNVPVIMHIAVIGLAVVRIALCLCPQNGWTSEEPSYKWNIIRNIPFTLLGIVVLIAYAAGASGPLSLAWLAILLSFGFYIPVVLFAGKYPATGALMIPKTCAYIWLVAMGFGLV